MKKEILKQELLRDIRAMKLRMLEREKSEETLGIPSSRKLTEQFTKEAAEEIMETYVVKRIEAEINKTVVDAIG